MVKGLLDETDMKIANKQSVAAASSKYSQSLCKRGLEVRTILISLHARFK